ncbi:MAG: D-alanyl-D-alanine carboxypeptidase family protein [Hyphomonadaceae bacterium]|nr:D-alanyl-D-alanine carboxypeptidase family protein [Hyphomonadaceae bacterium]
MKTVSLIAWIRKAALVLALALFGSTPAWAGKYASIVIDLDTHQVLHAREADEQRHPASLTKVMTLYMVFDALESGKLKLSDRMPVSKAASRAQPSKLGLKAGTTIKVEDAIRALVTKSANDVAIVIAEKLGGTEAKFVTKMNAKAKELGMASTTFRNSSGLPDKRQVTTARDMAKLAEAVYADHKNRYNYFSLSSFTWNKRKYTNHNELLRKVDGVDGIKTGFTNASGYNLMASAERGGRRVIAVMMGGTTGRSRDQHVADLLEAAFMELNGTLTADNDLRTRIAFGEHGNSSADDLALAQLRKLTDGEAALVSATDPALVAAFDVDASTEEGDESFEEVAEGDSEAIEDPIGALIDASPATTQYGATPVNAAQVIVPASEAILVTSEAIAGAGPSEASLNQLAMPVTP